MQPIIDDLRMESTAEHPEQVVTVQGRVNVPGQSPLQPGMRVADLSRRRWPGGCRILGHGRADALCRRAGGTRHTEIIDVDLAAALSGNPAANMRLEPYDWSASRRSRSGRTRKA